MSAHSTSDEAWTNAVVWRGSTPSGMDLVVERDTADGRWVVTVAGCSRGRRPTLPDALYDAAGGTVGREWLDGLARHLEATTVGTSAGR
jgi:hypothetical protein